MNPVEFKSPLFFLNENRLDIACKFLYVKSYLETNDEYIFNLYRKIILLRTGGSEPFDNMIPNQKSKDSVNQYVSSFNELILNFKNYGYNDNYPVYWAANCLVTGSHRIACALYFNTNVPSIKVSKKSNQQWGRKWFEENNFDNKDIILLEKEVQQHEQL